MLVRIGGLQVRRGKISLLLVPWRQITIIDTRKSVHDAEFTYTVLDNESGSDIEIKLEIRIAKTASSDPLTTIPFTIVQSQRLITAVGGNNNVTSAAAGEYEITFAVSRAFHANATHWWVTGNGEDGALPTGVSVSVTESAKAPKVVDKFTMTVPRNKDVGSKMYTLVLHAGTSVLPDEPSLHAKTFTVTQPGPLVNASKSELGIYTSSRQTLSENLVSKLGVVFSDAANDYWWVTAENGNVTLPGGMTAVQNSGSRAKANNTIITLNFTLPECTSTTMDCTYKLAVNVAESNVSPSVDRVSFTITQSRSLARVTQYSYEITAAMQSTSLYLKRSDLR